MIRKGTTIIELVVAIGIIITGLLVVVGLITRSIYVGTRAKNELLALSLAQEGIEAVRSMRDSNALAIEAKEAGWNWDTDIEGFPPNYSGVPIVNFDYTATPENFIQGAWLIDYNANDITNNDTNIYRYTASGDYPGLYFQTLASVPANTVDTGFNRLVSVIPICDDLLTYNDPDRVTIPADTCEHISPGSLKKVGIQIVSQVEWTEGRTTQLVELTQNVYDWR